jgi:hypothetical protein
MISTYKFALFAKSIIIVMRLATSVLKCAVRMADETSNRTIECPVLDQMINQNYILIIKFIDQLLIELVERIADAMLSFVLINI